MYHVALEKPESNCELYDLDSNVRRLVEVVTSANCTLEQEFECIDCLASFWNVSRDHSWIGMYT